MIPVQDIFNKLPEDSYGLISCEELNERQKKPTAPYILDIRKNADWKKSRINGSVHREWEAVGGLIDSGSLPDDRDIVVVCYVGQSSGQVTGVLRTLGFRAYSLLDGFNEWKSAGYPVESAAEVNQ
jgi:rhodanese-related sulfurtransferase